MSGERRRHKNIMSNNIVLAIGHSARDTFQMLFDSEISMEANPGTVTSANLLAYRQAGINRISFGLQSTNNEELKTLTEDIKTNFLAKNGELMKMQKPRHTKWRMVWIMFRQKQQF